MLAAKERLNGHYGNYPLLSAGESGFVKRRNQTIDVITIENSHENGKNRFVRKKLSKINQKMREKPPQTFVYCISYSKINYLTKTERNPLRKRAERMENINFFGILPRKRAEQLKN